MSPIRGYINEESEHSAFVVYTTQRNSRRSPVESNIAPCDEIGNFQPLEDFHSKMFDFNPMDTIKEQSTTLILTNPKLSSTLLFDMDVFGQTLDSVDVWSEEDVFSWTRMDHSSPRSTTLQTQHLPYRTDGRLEYFHGIIDLTRLWVWNHKIFQPVSNWDTWRRYLVMVELIPHMSLSCCLGKTKWESGTCDKMKTHFAILIATTTKY